jgi:hypothetical protein
MKSMTYKKSAISRPIGFLKKVTGQVKTLPGGQGSRALFIPPCDAPHPSHAVEPPYRHGFQLGNGRIGGINLGARAWLASLAMHPVFQIINGDIPGSGIRFCRRNGLCLLFLFCSHLASKGKGYGRPASSKATDQRD